ncbi:alpha/beta hydrolase [Actinomycetes bacterium]|nr:alpha/beta hydrolase [Actinomycetes bacterium]
MKVIFRLRLFVISALVGLLVASSPAALASVRADWRGVRLEVRAVDAAGTSFAWAELGAGPTLLLLNGTGSPMSEWDPKLLAALAKNRRVIVFDYPGLGLSGPAPSKWEFSAAADWVNDFLTQVSPGAPVDVLGWSMGGFVAQQLSIRHPTSIRRLVLAATNPGGDAAVLGPLWVQEADSNSEGSIKSYLETNYPATKVAQSRGRAFISRLVSANVDGSYPDESVPTKTYNAMVAAEDPWLQSNANANALRAISARTLVITGAKDVITPPANSRYIAGAIPNAKLMLVPVAGHSFLFQEPIQVASSVSKFLDSES